MITNVNPFVDCTNGNKKFIATFDEQKKEIKNEITSIDDIFNFSDELKRTVEGYDGGKE